MIIERLLLLVYATSMAQNQIYLREKETATSKKRSFLDDETTHPRKRAFLDDDITTIQLSKTLNLKFNTS